MAIIHPSSFHIAGPARWTSLGIVILVASLTWMLFKGTFYVMNII